MNLLTTITNRAGKVWLRVGGNTQDLATVVPQGLPKGAAIEKLPGNVNAKVIIAALESFFVLRTSS